MSALRELYRIFVQEKIASSRDFSANLEDLFKGLCSCLQTPQLQKLSTANDTEVQSGQISEFIVEIILKTNQVLFEMMTDITNFKQLEAQMAQLISIFIENLGSPKAIVRKSTHKCIGTYVKLTKKLEFVILHIIHTGLENPNSRTRQHSMLVIPALLSLRTQIVDTQCSEMKELVQAVIKRIRSDSSEIVSKTGKKLIIELQKCYPNKFGQNYIQTIGNPTDKLICEAVLNNDESLLMKALSSQAAPATKPQAQVASPTQLPNQNNMSRVGREIISNIPQAQPAKSAPLKNAEEATQPNLISKQPSQKDVTLQPLAKNGLAFSFIMQTTIDKLEENQEWKDRIEAIEAIEHQLNNVLQQADRKTEFLPHSTAFLGFVIQFIKDINFKVCLTSIYITNKLLVLNIVNVKKHYSQLASVLIEKLSDSKVVIRQAVLKCCGLLIKGYQPTLFMNHAIRYLHHTNWHVREGILHLIANCLIAQSQLDEMNASSSRQNKEQDSISFHDSNNLAQSPSLISELCHVAKNESKQKIQQMAIDCLALCLDISQNQKKTEQIIKREMGQQEGGDISQQIQERLNKDSLPSMQIDGSIEFKPVESAAIAFNPPAYQDDQSNPVSAIKENKLSLPPAQKHPYPQSEQKPQSEGVKLQMRFQQERIQNNQSQQISNSFIQRNQLKTPQKIEPITQKTPDVGASKRPQFENNLMKQSNREQYSMSTINHSGDQPIQKSNPFVQIGGPTPQKQYHLKKISDQRNDTQLPNLSKKSESCPQGRKEVPQNEQAADMNDFGRGLKSQVQGDAQIDHEFGKDQQKIQMWLPSFKQNDKAASPSYAINSSANGRNSLHSIGSNNNPAYKNPAEGRSSKEGYQQFPDSKEVSPYLPSSKERGLHRSFKQQQSLNDHQRGIIGKEAIKFGNLNATSSSAATIMEDGKNITTQATILSGSNLSNRAAAHIGINSKGNSGNILVSEVASAVSPTLNPKRNPKPFSTGNQKDYSQQQTDGYTPSTHLSKPRHIQSNEMRQRTLGEENSPKLDTTGQKQSGFMSIQQSPLIFPSNHYNMDAQSSKTNLVQDPNEVLKIKQKNMSQSSGAPGGFGVHKSEINERLQLLKSTFKYKNASEFDHQSNPDTANTFDNRAIKLQPGAGDNSGKAVSEYNVKSIPQKPSALPNNFMVGFDQAQSKNQTHNSFGISNVSTNINNAISSNIPHNEYNNLNITSKDQSSNRQRKPPKGLFPSQNQGSAIRANQAGDQDEFPLNLQGYPRSEVSNSTTAYNAPDEPLNNPESQFKTSVQNLTSEDWQKVFEALNILKRVALFHKHLLSAQSSGQLYKDCMKGVVKQTDNLRSQVAKNASMTLQVIFTELPTKDLDPYIDMVLAALIKKATDTNHFVSEQAEKALMMVCNACTDTKVLNSLQNVNGRGNQIKKKICMCYSTLIAKLGQKLKTFKDCERLVKAVVAMLSEGALEVRNQAKLGILTIKNNFQNAREFEGLLLKCNLSEKQIEQVRKIVEQGDYESLSNFMNTRYGGSMRGSSLDSRSAATDLQRRTPNAIPRNHAAGSDGFNQSLFSDQKMQSTFLSGGGLPPQNIGSSNGFGQTQGNQQAVFKKRQPSVSKPVDPQLMEEFKSLIQGCSTSDWSSRLSAMEKLNQWVIAHSITIRQTQASKFIQLLDIQCKLIQDNNIKVQGTALNQFSAFLKNQNLRSLIDSNLTMIVQALAHNLCATQQQIRTYSEELFILLEQTTDSPPQLIQPIVAQINLSNNRSKPQLVEILVNLLESNPYIIDQYPSMIDRYVAPLVRSQNKIQQEAQANPRLREALKLLEGTIQNYYNKQ